jgi:hypothetical protein
LKLSSENLAWTFRPGICAENLDHASPAVIPKPSPWSNRTTSISPFYRIEALIMLFHEPHFQRNRDKEKRGDARRTPLSFQLTSRHQIAAQALADRGAPELEAHEGGSRGPEITDPDWIVE